VGVFGLLLKVLTGNTKPKGASNMGKIYDFSQWQQTIDFTKVKTEADLIVLRVQSGSTHADANYKTYVAGAKANKIPFGTYAYAKFVSVADALQEAKDCRDRLDMATQFVVVDVEEVDCPTNQLVYATQAYIDYLHQYGITKVGLYSGEAFYKAHGLSAVRADFLWIANYGVDDGQPHTKPSIPCDLWQFTDKGKASGVVTAVDVDQLNGTKPLSYFTGIVPAPVVAPAPAPKPVAVVKPVVAPTPKPVVKPAPVAHVAPVKPKFNLPTGIYRTGVQGAGVKVIQEALNYLHFNCGTPDGKYGAGTANAVRRFQMVYCNPADGVYGAKYPQGND
jgi:GH25 family lysozyme M1 (1,4-beta-N-acetylmuramidase)